MKYLILVVLLLVVWTAVRTFFLEDSGSGGPVTFGDKLRNLGRHVHSTIGIVAVILIVLLVVRLLYNVLWLR
jgi:hypothetical protein